MARAGGIEFFHGTFEEAKALAKEQDKLLFVDAYAQWCGPCKRMAANVFTQDEVGDYYNSRFVNVKMDMENGEGPLFARDYPVSAYPTLMFIDYDGTLVHQQKGAQQAAGLLKLGEFALRKIDRSGQYEAQYAEGNRMPQLVYDYVKALNKAGKPSLKIANDYLRTQEDLTTPFNLKFILEATTTVDSKPYEYLMTHQKAIGQQEGLDALRARIYQAAENTASKAVSYRSADLLGQAQRAVAQFYPERAKRFTIDTNLRFQRGGDDDKAYYKAADALAKELDGKDAKALSELALEVAGRAGDDDAKALKRAVGYARTAAEQGRRYELYLLYAKLLSQRGDQKAAIAAAEQAVRLAEAKDPRTAAAAKRYLNQLRG